MPQREPIVLGWREWVALPQLGIIPVRAKIDSGARTSSLRVESLEEFERDDGTWLRFVVRSGRRGAAPRTCEAPAVDRRLVSDSGGHRGLRWFVRTEFALAGRRWRAELNLIARADALFPLLLGRNALGGFVIDPAAACLHGRPRRLRRKSP